MQKESSLLSMRHLWLTLFCGTLCLTPVAVSTAPVSLPDIGDPSGALMSPAQELALGEALVRNIRARSRVASDPEVNEYIENLGFRLVAHSDRPEQHFGFFVVQLPSINAFALPGGFIGTNSGLITTAANENELAAVLSHEIAHVTQRHITRGYEAVDRMSIPTVAAILASIILGAQDPGLGQAALIAVMGSSAQYQLNFTRTHEYEADWIGINTLQRAGFDPSSMSAFFEKLQDNNRLQGRSAPEFLSTHPVTINRISDSRSRAAKFEPRTYADSLEFQLIRAKLMVLEETNNARLLETLEKQYETGQTRHHDAGQYALALALLRASQFVRARALISELRKRNPSVINYRLAYAELEQAEHGANKALPSYEDSLKFYPYNYPLVVGYARALIDAKHANKARSVLRNFITRRPKDALLFELLATAEELSGHKIESHRHYAEFFFLNGRTGEAVAQLEQALKLPGIDKYQKGAVDARLTELKDIISAEAKAKER
jgi:beta-barrel assembly-enhancing protease